MYTEEDVIGMEFTITKKHWNDTKFNAFSNI